MNIVTGVFDSTRTAEEAVTALRNARFATGDIGIFTRDREKGTILARDMDREYTDRWGNSFTSDNHVYSSMPDPFTTAIRESNLHDEAVTWYGDHMNQGHILVTVQAGDRMDDAERIMQEHGGLLYGRERHMEAAERTTTAAEGEIRLPIVDEEVEVVKRQQQVGEVCVTSDVTRENVEFPTTVTHEEIHVERRKLERPLHPDEYKGMQRAEGELRMPIIEEEVMVTKRPIIREEMVVTRMPVTERETIHETVTHTEPHIETTGEVEMEGMTEEERRRRGRPAA
ncbi:MAG: YsnF/AvaK domain-containing protein [Armatimonadota bacterium]